MYVLGRRVHEWHLGCAFLLAVAVATVLGRDYDSQACVIAALGGLWLVAKDWRDLFATRRDTSVWRLGLHARPSPLRAVRRADPLPQLAGLAAALAAVVNLVSAASPNIGWRHHALLRAEPLEAVRLSHAVAVPASLFLLVTAPYLWRRRAAALRLALFLLLALAAVDTAAFSLDGRPIRKVRQSVTRLERLGYHAELRTLATLSAAELAQLDHVSAQWLTGTPERGFSMALDDLRADDHGETLVLLGRDGDEGIRGFLHFVPSYGRPAVSRSAMRRERETPNGLTEFSSSGRSSCCAPGASRRCRSTSPRSAVSSTARAAGPSACWGD